MISIFGKDLNKKGFDFSLNFTAKLILLAAILIVVLLFVSKWQQSAVDAASAQTCRASVLSNAALHLKGIELSRSINTVNCPIEEVTIETKKDMEIKQALAEEMRKCWFSYFEGKLNLFSDEGTYCSVCSHIEFENTGYVENFNYYLYSKKIKELDMSYMSYLNGYKTDKAKDIVENVDEKFLQDLSTTSIDMEKDYSVIYVYARGEDAIKDLIARAQSTSGIIAAGGATATGVALYFAGGVISGGTILLVGGTVVVAAAVWNYLTVKGVPPQWMSYVVLREYNEEQLEKLGCEYIPTRLE